MKRRYRNTLICLLVGVAMLATAVFANASNLSAYSTYKDAAKKFILSNNSNFTMEAKMEASIKDLLFETETVRKCSKGDFSEKTISKDSSSDEESGVSENYLQDGKYSIYKGSNSDKYNVHEIGGYMMNNETNLFGIDENNTEEAEKIIRFAELVGDALMGDIRNNFTMQDIGDGEKQVELSLSGPQVPELFNLGLSIISNRANEGYTAFALEPDPDNPLQYFSEDISIKSIQYKGTIDSQDNLTGGNAEIIIAGKDIKGEINEFNIKVSFKLYNYGTTVPDRIDLNDPNVDFNDNSKWEKYYDNGDGTETYYEDYDNEYLPSPIDVKEPVFEKL